MTIMCSSIQMVEKIFEKSDKVKIITEARATDLGTEKHRGVGTEGAR